MMREQARTLEGLRTAIHMEIDGKEYYQKLSSRSGNQLGAELLQRLAAEEDVHRREFEQIYRSIQMNNNWPRVDFKPDSGKTLQTIFAEATSKLGIEFKSFGGELDALQTALQMEMITYEFYRLHSKDAIYPAEKDLYDAVSGEERMHHLILLDYYEFLKSPAAYFVRTEHPSLDGG